MVTSLSLVFMVVTLLISFVVPIAAVIFLYKKWNISIGAVFAGAGVFILFQLIIRMPLLGKLAGFPWFQDMAENVFLYAVFLGLTAGIVEEVGRFFGYRLMLNKRLEWKNGLAFGIGHGACEAILIVGLTYINNIIYSLMINSGAFDTTIVPLIDSDMAQMIRSSLVDTPSYMFMLGGLERLFTMVIHVALSLLVLLGLMNKKYVYLFYSILVHALLNIIAVLLGQVNIWVSELSILAFAIAALVFIIKSYSFDSLKPPGDVL